MMDPLNYRRRDFLKAVGIGAASLSIPGSFSQSCRRSGLEKTKRPNFVFILVDDLGWADTGCYGSTFYETPNIDRLARQGMKFTDGYAACAVCSPTRASIMTGRYPARLGITDWIRASFQGTKVPPDKKNPTGFVGGKDKKLLCPLNALWMESDEVTIAEALKQAGYTSCYIGKWHLGFEDWYPDKQGFDYNIGGCDYGHPPSYFDPYYKEGHGNIPTLNPRKEGEYLTDREGDEAVRFIKDHGSQPFFLYMSHYAVHTPLQGKKDLIEKYETRKLADWQNPVYAAMVESVDQAVGKILSTLDEMNLTKNTVIIFTSDNGGLVGPTNNSPLRSGKGYPYEGGIRVPFLVHWPEVVRPGSECHVPASSIDFLPTICEAAGVKQPDDRIIDGKSLMSLLKQTDSLKRDNLFWHFPHYRRHYPPSRPGHVVPYSIIRSRDWKLLKRYEGKIFELFNLKDDLSEKTDLTEQFPEKVRELDAKLTAWLEDTGAKLPKENPEYDPNF